MHRENVQRFSFDISTWQAEYQKKIRLFCTDVMTYETSFLCSLAGIRGANAYYSSKAKVRALHVRSRSHSFGTTFHTIQELSWRVYVHINKPIRCPFWYWNIDIATSILQTWASCTYRPEIPQCWPALSAKGAATPVAARIINGDIVIGPMYLRRYPTIPVKPINTWKHDATIIAPWTCKF